MASLLTTTLSTTASYAPSTTLNTAVSATLSTSRASMIANTVPVCWIEGLDDYKNHIFPEFTECCPPEDYFVTEDKDKNKTQQWCVVLGTQYMNGTDINAVGSAGAAKNEVILDSNISGCLFPKLTQSNMYIHSTFNCDWPAQGLNSTVTNASSSVSSTSATATSSSMTSATRSATSSAPSSAASTGAAASNRACNRIGWTGSLLAIGLIALTVL